MNSKAFFLIAFLFVAIFLLSYAETFKDEHNYGSENDEAGSIKAKCYHGCCKWYGSGSGKYCGKCCKTPQEAALLKNQQIHDNVKGAEETKEEGNMEAKCYHGCCKWYGYGSNKYCEKCCKTPQEAALMENQHKESEAKP